MHWGENGCMRTRQCTVTTGKLSTGTRSSDELPSDPFSLRNPVDNFPPSAAQTKQTTKQAPRPSVNHSQTPLGPGSARWTTSLLRSPNENQCCQGKVKWIKVAKDLLQYPSKKHGESPQNACCKCKIIFADNIPVGWKKSAQLSGRIALEQITKVIFCSFRMIAHIFMDAAPQRSFQVPDEPGNGWALSVGKDKMTSWVQHSRNIV